MHKALSIRNLVLAFLTAFSALASAQQIAPSQIRPGTNGQCIITASSVTQWGSCFTGAVLLNPTSQQRITNAAGTNFQVFEPTSESLFSVGSGMVFYGPNTGGTSDLFSVYSNTDGNKLVWIAGEAASVAPGGLNASAINTTFYTSSLLSLSSCLTLAESVSGTCVMPANYTETLTGAGPTISTAGVKLLGQPGSKIVGGSSSTALTISSAAGATIEGITISLPSGGSGITIVGSDGATLKGNTITGCTSYCFNAANSNNLTFEGNTETTGSGSGSNGIFVQNTSKATTGLRIFNNVANIYGSADGIAVHSNSGTYVNYDIDIEHNTSYIYSASSIFGIEVGAFPTASINQSGGKISGNLTILEASGSAGGISLNAQDGVDVSGNTLDANGYTFTNNAVEVTQNSNHNSIIGNHVVNAPSTNIGAVFDMNGGSFNHFAHNGGTNVGHIYLGYSGTLSTNSNVIEDNDIALSAAETNSTTHGAVWLQCNSNATSSETCNDNIFRDNKIRGNGSVSNCLTAEADITSGLFSGLADRNRFEGNSCLNFSGTWYLYTNYANYATVTNTILSKNIGVGATEIQDTAGSVLWKDNISFPSVGNQTSTTTGFIDSTLTASSGALCANGTGGKFTNVGCTGAGYSLGGTLSSGNLTVAGGAGLSASAIVGLDGNHQITFTTGTTAPPVNTTLFTVTYTATRGHASVPLLDQTDDFPFFTTLGQVMTLGTFTSTSYSIKTGGTALPASTAFVINVSAP